MAEDDDDEAFGDFAFAPFQSNSLINGLNSSAAKAEEDDDWGDFVQPPLESKPSETATNGYHRSDNSVSLATWMKPSGALPMSIFGGTEEDEEVPNDLVVSVDLNRGKSFKIAEGFGSVLAGNGVSNPEKFSIADLYDRYLQIKPENLAGSDFAGNAVSVENGVYSGANNNAAGSAVSELKNMDFSNALVVRDQNQLANKSVNDDFSFSSYTSDTNKDDIFGGWTGDFNGFSSNMKAAPQNLLMSSLDLDTNGQKQELDVSAIAIDDDGGVDDDEEWDFKDANSELPIQHVNNNADFVVDKFSESNPHSSGTGIGSTKSLHLFGTSNGSIDFFASSTEPVDYFANSSGVSTTFQEMDLIGIQPTPNTLNGFASDELLVVEQNNGRGLLEQGTNVEIEEHDKDFGEFSAISAEIGTEPNELFMNTVLPPIKDVVQMPDEKTKEKDTKLNNRKGAIPLSIFGEEEPESAGSSDAQDFFVHESISSERSDLIAGRVNSIHDMISNLYSQAEQTTSTITVYNVTEAQLNPSSVVSSSNLVEDDDDDDDDGSWDFKDASPIRVDSEASLSSMGDGRRSISSKLKLNSYLDFYLKLKEELCFSVKRHIDRLKNVGGDAAFFGEGGIASSFDSEFQLICDEMNFLEEGALQDHHTRDIHLNEFAQVLLEPSFQRLESEYHLSQKLLLVENDLGSSMELMRHTNAMLKILNIGTPEEQSLYVSLWSEMISVCAQELRHGAWIWKDAVAKHVEGQLLSEPQGSNFVLALGEIYRLVVVLGASAELFKPWILSGSVDSPSIYTLLEECRVVWSTSGLEEALSSVLVPTSLDDASLFKSIKHILSLDVLKLENYVFSEKESRCCLSLLTAGVVPDLKVVKWGNEQCFVTLANLWSNLISRNPPKLPQLNLG